MAPCRSREDLDGYNNRHRDPTGFFSGCLLFHRHFRFWSLFCPIHPVDQRFFFRRAALFLVVDHVQLRSLCCRVLQFHQIFSCRLPVRDVLVHVLPERLDRDEFFAVGLASDHLFQPGGIRSRLLPETIRRAHSHHSHRDRPDLPCWVTSGSTSTPWVSPSMPC
jgi:hypothetical protein